MLNNNNWLVMNIINNDQLPKCCKMDKADQNYLYFLNLTKACSKVTVLPPLINLCSDSPFKFYPAQSTTNYYFCFNR